VLSQLNFCVQFKVKPESTVSQETPPLKSLNWSLEGSTLKTGLSPFLYNLVWLPMFLMLKVRLSPFLTPVTEK